MKLEYGKIYPGDCRELIKNVPDESVDMIFTDPPYLKEYLPLYGWLSEEGARVLKPGGWCFVYGGAVHLHEELSLLTQHLDYFWVFALLHNGGQPRMWDKQLFSGYKPVMVLTKGKPTRKAWMNTIYSDTGRPDKNYHKWGQGLGFPTYIISKLTEPNDIILEPFSGGGTTCVACKILERRFIAFEIDESQATIAQKRADEQQPPLAGFAERQAGMDEYAPSFMIPTQSD